MYSIGEFSKITSLTVKALRHYHEKGILIPSSVDTQTGYRYYSRHDLDVARVIVTLKSFKFSLDEIASFLSDMNEDADVIDALEAKKSQIASNIKNLKTVSSAIDLIINKEREAKKMTTFATDIQMKTVPQQLVVSLRWQGAHADTGKAMGNIYRAGGRHTAGPAINLCYDGEYKEIADIESCLPIKKQVKSNLECRVLPD